MLSNDWVIRYDTRYLQVARQSQQAPARSTVVVREPATGAIEIRYRGRLLRWSEIAAPPPKPVAPAPRPPVRALTSRPVSQRPPSADHPWQHGVDDYRARLELAAAKRAWRAVQP